MHALHSVKNMAYKVRRTIRAYLKLIESSVAQMRRRNRLIVTTLVTLIFVVVVLGIILGLTSTELSVDNQPNEPASTNVSGSAPQQQSSQSPSVGSSVAPSTASAPPSTAGALSIYPSSILNLTNWKLTLPVSATNSGGPEEISQPALASFNDAPYFYVNAPGSGVVFQAPVGGVTTTNSNFPRSELREMTGNGAQEASWSTKSGTSTMTVEEAVTHLPVARPQVVTAQVHGPSDYVLLVRLNGSELFVEHKGKNVGTLNSNYVLGTIYTVTITASNGYIQVFYNGVQKANFASSGSGDYFKAGCYTQSNPKDGDSLSAYGQVTLYSLQVNHS